VWCVEKTDSLPSRISDRSYSVSGPKSFAGSWCVAVLLLGPLASAADELPSTGETKIDEWHDLLADSVVGSSEWLDSFFLDDNYSSEANTTRATISVSSFTEQGEGTDTRARFRLRLRLPRLENRAMLYISGSGDEFDSSNSSVEDINQARSGSDDESLSISLRRFFRDDERINTSIGGGVRFRSSKVVGYVEPRYRYFRSFDAFDARFVQRLRWYTDVGLESRTELQLERPVFDNWFFRSTSAAEWFEDEDGLFPRQVLEWSRVIDDQRVLSYSASGFFETEPQNVLSSAVIGARYRQQIWRRWLWFEVAPQVSFPRENDYDATAGLFLKLEAEFQRN
jgi:hypothetical protein